MCNYDAIQTRDVCETFMPPLDIHYRVHKPFGHEWKLQIIGIFQIQGPYLWQKWLDRTQNTTWPRYSYDKFAYQISLQYLQPVQRKWTETANYWNFSKSKGHNSGKNGSIVPKTKLDLDILTKNLYTKFHCNISATSAKKMNGNCKLLEFFEVQFKP